MRSNKHPIATMASNVQNTCAAFYDIVVNDIINELKKDQLLTPEIQAVCDRLKSNVAQGGAKNKKERKAPKITGYNVYMREHREVVKAQHPHLTSQQLVTHMATAWKKEYDEEFRQGFNKRAADMQAERDKQN